MNNKVVEIISRNRYPEEIIEDLAREGYHIVSEPKWSYEIVREEYDRLRVEIEYDDVKIASFNLIPDYYGWNLRDWLAQDMAYQIGQELIKKLSDET